MQSVMIAQERERVPRTKSKGLMIMQSEMLAQERERSSKAQE